MQSLDLVLTLMKWDPKSIGVDASFSCRCVRWDLILAPLTLRRDSRCTYEGPTSGMNLLGKVRSSPSPDSCSPDISRAHTITVQKYPNTLMFARERPKQSSQQREVNRWYATRTCFATTGPDVAIPSCPTADCAISLCGGRVLT